MIQTTVRFSDEFNERLRIEMARRRVKSLQQAIDEALGLWLGGGVAAATPTVKPDTQESAQLADFLLNGDAGQVQVVRMILEEHTKRQRASRKRNSA